MTDQPITVFPEVGTTWRHKKSGGVYKVKGLCMIEAMLNPGVIYEGGNGFHADGTTWTTWCRPASEFMDGRFERVTGPGCVEPNGSLCFDCKPHGTCMAI